MPLLSRTRESQSTPSPLMRLSSRQGDVRLAPRAVFLDAQRSFFSSKKEEETAKAAPEEEKAELSEAEKALHERIAELQEKHADVLNKAVTAVPAEALQDSQYLKDMHQGLQLTETQLLKVFGKHGLVQENPVGEKFDPNKHDALFQIPSPDKEPN